MAGHAILLLKNDNLEMTVERKTNCHRGVTLKSKITELRSSRYHEKSDKKSGTTFKLKVNYHDIFRCSIIKDKMFQVIKIFSNVFFLKNISG